MLEIALEITLCLLISTFIGFGLGYITSELKNEKYTKKRQLLKEEESIEKVIDANEETFFEKSTLAEFDVSTSAISSNKSEAKQKPEILDAPQNNKKDTLTKIKGIGPKVEEQLNNTGIYHFSQIANWSEANIKWLEINTTFAHRAKKDLWINQAKALIS